MTREYFRELPPRVEYCLTPIGLSLDTVLEGIASWGAIHLMQGDVPCEQVDLDLYFFHLPYFFCRDKAREMNATVAIELVGQGGGTWSVAVQNGLCTVAKEATTKPAATIRTDVETWVEFMANHRDPAGLALSPLVEFDGDVELARRFGDLFCLASPLQAVAVSAGAGDCGCE